LGLILFVHVFYFILFLFFIFFFYDKYIDRQTYGRTEDRMKYRIVNPTCLLEQKGINSFIQSCEDAQD